jgi:pimeloyl-ACP methyl ester carboxylesterase
VPFNFVYGGVDWVKKMIEKDAPEKLIENLGHPGDRVEIIKGAGHNIHMDQPE